MPRPISIENRWDILYRDYPEVYDAFARFPYQPTIYEALAQVIDLSGKRVADIGAGTGESTAWLAERAGWVLGIDHEPAMLRLARQRQGPRTVFAAGDALALPLTNACVDVVAGITLALYPPELYRGFILEGRRAAREWVVYAGIAPGWYGGDLHEVIDEQAEDLQVIDRIFLNEFNFAFHDCYSIQEYGTVEQMISTYGFIFGRRAIDYLIQANRTTIRWKFRIYYQQVAA